MFFRRKVKHELTPKGECLVRYLQEQLNGSKDYIEAYEEILKECNKIYEKDKLTRNEVIEKVLEYFSTF